MAGVSAGALSAALGVSELRKMAEEWSQFKNRIASTGVATDEVGAKMQELVDIALRTRSSIEGIGSAYQSIKRAQSELGASEAQVLHVTENLSKALALGGQGAEQAKAALLQTAQALASGTLQGDELRSILENAPELAGVIASQLGVAVGKLKDLGSQGKITSKDLFESILNATDRLNEKWATLTPTIGQSVQVLTTALTKYIGEADQAAGVSAKIASGIQGVASNMDVAAPLAATLAAALAGAFGGSIIAGIAAATVAFVGFKDKIRPVAGEIASLGDYARAAFDLVKEEAGEVATGFQSKFAEAAHYIASALGSVDAGEAWSNLLQGAKLVANQVIGAFAFAAKMIGASWSSLGIVITGTIIDAMNAAIASVEGAVNKVASAINSLSAIANHSLGASFPAIQPLDLGRIKNSYGEAGRYAAEAFGDSAKALTHDYIGDLDAAIQTIRQRANQEGIRRTFDHKVIETEEGTLNQRLKSAAKKDKDSESGSGASNKETDFQRKISELERQARGYDLERETIGKEAREVERAKVAFDLLEAAKKANVPVTDELRSKVDGLAEAYANSKVALDEAQKKFDDFRSGVAAAGSDLRDAFSSAIIEGRQFGDVLDSLLKKLANRLFESAFDGIFGSLTKGLSPSSLGGATTGSVAGSITPTLMSGIGKLLGFAEGGLIQGPGGPRSDSILAAVSNGEFVMNAGTTARYLPLLQALNSGQVPRFANGGLVGGAPSFPPLGAAVTGGRGDVHISAPVTVNASGGTPEQNADLAKRTSDAIEATMRGVVVDELRRQMRPGNILATQYRR
jgi:tape measure domain-containing protein